MNKEIVMNNLYFGWNELEEIKNIDEVKDIEYIGWIQNEYSVNKDFFKYNVIFNDGTSKYIIVNEELGENYEDTHFKWLAYTTCALGKSYGFEEHIIDNPPTPLVITHSQEHAETLLIDRLKKASRLLGKGKYGRYRENCVQCGQGDYEMVYGYTFGDTITDIFNKNQEYLKCEILSFLIEEGDSGLSEKSIYLLFEINHDSEFIKIGFYTDKNGVERVSFQDANIYQENLGHNGCNFFINVVNEFIKIIESNIEVL